MALASLTQWMRDNRELSVLKLDGVEWRDLKFPNNESYRGGWKDSRVRTWAPLVPPAGCCLPARPPACLPAAVLCWSRPALERAPEIVHARLPGPDCCPLPC